MLNSINLNDKNYEDLYAEALAQIAIYSKEWTNLNPSDPGITLLENLTAFNLLQQSRIDEVTDEIRCAMLKLLGCVPHGNRAATVFARLQEGEKAACLPAQYRFHSGTLCFETESVTPLFDWSVRKVYTCGEDGFCDITHLVGQQPGTANVFGMPPQEGNTIYFVLEGEIPKGEKVYFRIESGSGRACNPLPEQDDTFAHRIQWQAYTADGWVDMETEDESRSFFTSGIIGLNIPECGLAEYTETPEPGWGLRCVLVEKRGENPAEVQLLTENLFPLVQKQTHSRSFLFDGNERVEVASQLAADGFLFVYCKEAEGEDYRLYRASTANGERGRFCTIEQLPNGAVIHFDREKFGFGPVAGENTVCVVCCDEDMLHHRDLGVVYGYEDQILPLEFMEDVLPEPFSVLAEIPDGSGGSFYRIVKAGQTDPHELCFALRSHEGEIKIIHPGVGTEYRLYICDCAVTGGSIGNIREGSVLVHREGLPGMEREVRVQCIGPGRGGQSWESPEDMRLRFSSDLRKVQTAVLPSDYMTLAMQTPGLAIHKVNAWAQPEKNLVRVVVKPRGNGEPCPKCSQSYMDRISGYLDRFRMITTRVELLQPRYVPVHVTAGVCVKRHYRSVEQEVRTVLTRLLDHAGGEEGFGGCIRFDELHRTISAIPGVVSVDSLYLTADDTTGAKQVGTDIFLAQDSLCCPGKLHLEFHYEIIRGR